MQLQLECETYIAYHPPDFLSLEIRPSKFPQVDGPNAIKAPLEVSIMSSVPGRCLGIIMHPADASISPASYSIPVSLNYVKIPLSQNFQRVNCRFRLRTSIRTLAPHLRLQCPTLQSNSWKRISKNSYSIRKRQNFKSLCSSNNSFPSHTQTLYHQHNSLLLHKQRVNLIARKLRFLVIVSNIQMLPSLLYLLI
jgi:hypothetical protein